MATLHIDHDQLLAKHRDNVLASLTRRLEVAKSSNNSQLVALLEQEKQQVDNIAVSHKKLQSPIAWLHALQQHFVDAITPNRELQVSQFMNGSDLWWYAFDPRTGQCVYADSEAELRLWVKENYQGR
jgi:hypothetical protein